MVGEIWPISSWGDFGVQYDGCSTPRTGGDHTDNDATLTAILRGSCPANAAASRR
eukprot:CAMPEP_0116038200 /NCGR_PEP_ID=MMETSP0321-20121206/22623_1 /TAXON_ID=163516 /ORGANISM="Leptocylindrus danicus var. danicus, Strain B650" /LENGTH=54 /DNA_ID=CAMNT_0003516781 /DNA_START=12 /DNA_END=172 /DNA_ORIENTATION=-